jgi:hypothetical protein
MTVRYLFGSTQLLRDRREIWHDGELAELGDRALDLPWHRLAAAPNTDGPSRAADHRHGRVTHAIAGLAIGGVFGPESPLGGCPRHQFMWHHGLPGVGRKGDREAVLPLEWPTTAAPRTAVIRGIVGRRAQRQLGGSQRDYARRRPTAATAALPTSASRSRPAVPGRSPPTDHHPPIANAWGPRRPSVRESRKT